MLGKLQPSVPYQLIALFDRVEVQIGAEDFGSFIEK